MRRYLVTWVDADEILDTARKAGWKDGDDAPLDFAPAEYHQSCQDFPREDVALKFARSRLASDFFGQVEIEDQELEIEPMGDGGPPLRSWETRRYCHVDDQESSPVWETADVWLDD